MFLLIISLFCQNAALAIPILALTSCSHLAFSVIQLPRYLYCSTCCNSTLSRVTRHCAFPSLQTTITLVFFTFIAIPYTLQVSLNLSIIFCSFFFVSATDTASSAYLKFVMLLPLKFIPFLFSNASVIMNSLYKLKSMGEITHPCLTPLFMSTYLLTSLSHLTAAC